MTAGHNLVLLTKLEDRDARLNTELPDLKGMLWLRAAVRRRDGVAGLERLARATKRSEPARAWCAAVVESGDWTRALAACAHSGMGHGALGPPFVESQAMGLLELLSTQQFKSGAQALHLRRKAG